MTRLNYTGVGDGHAFKDRWSRPRSVVAPSLSRWPLAQGRCDPRSNVNAPEIATSSSVGVYCGKSQLAEWLLLPANKTCVI